MEARHRPLGRSGAPPRRSAFRSLAAAGSRKSGGSFSRCSLAGDDEHQGQGLRELAPKARSALSLTRTTLAGFSHECSRFPAWLVTGKAVFELVLTLRLRTIWPVLLVVLFTRVSPFASLVGTGKAVILELLFLAPIVLVSHGFSLSVPASRSILCAASSTRQRERAPGSGATHADTSHDLAAVLACRGVRVPI